MKIKKQEGVMSEDFKSRVKKEFKNPGKAYVKGKVLTVDGEDEMEKGTDVLVTFSGRVPSDKYKNLFIGKYKGVEKGKLVNGKRTYDFLFDHVIHSSPSLQELFIVEHKDEGEDKNKYVQKIASWQIENEYYRIYHTISSTRNLALVAEKEKLPPEITGVLGSFFKPKGKTPKRSRHKSYTSEAQKKERERLKKEDLKQQEEEALAAMKTGGRRKTKKRLSKNRRHTSRK